MRGHRLPHPPERRNQSATQTRTFNYNLSTGRLTSATNPENGTVSYTYNADGSVATKTDAKNQVEAYTYDAFGRTTQITRTANGQERLCERVNLYYDASPFDGTFTENGWGRLAAMKYGCTSGQFREVYGYTAAGLPTKKLMQHGSYPWPEEPNFLQADYAYDNEGRTVSVTYPAEWGCVDESGFTYCPRPVFTYSFDSMGRPVALNQTAPESRGVASDVVYNAAGQITEMKFWSGGYRLETRQYNALQQLTRLTMRFNGVSKLDYEYRFSASQNDGRITQRKDWLSGEEVEYQYDSLQRLSAAATTGAGGWGQSFGYDGFGNLLSETVTKGSAPSLSVNVNPATNRITNAGMSYDANGNLTAMPGLTMTYDVSNRLTSATQTGVGTDNYIYDPSGRRVRRNGYFSFYGVDGSLLGEYSPNWPKGFYAIDTSVYFGKRVVQKGYNYLASPIYEDRLGSVEYSGTAAPKYFPYGDEPTTTTQNRPKFATYYRDATTALDYAQQRYYASTLGRFTSPDPYQASGGPADPQSWNRYAYVQNDPVNYNDPSGLMMSPAGLYGFWRGVSGAIQHLLGADGEDDGAPLDPWDPCGFSWRATGRCFVPLIAASAPPNRPPVKPVQTLAGLKVIDDCYDRSAQAFALGGGAALRRISYQPVDQFGAPFLGSVKVTERNTVQTGTPRSINTSWEVDDGGYFNDYYSSGISQKRDRYGNRAFQNLQSFTGTANGITGIPLKVFGFFGTFDENAVYATPQWVRINNTFPTNRDGTEHYCDQPKNWRIQ